MILCSVAVVFCYALKVWDVVKSWLECFLLKKNSPKENYRKLPRSEKSWKPHTRMYSVAAGLGICHSLCSTSANTQIGWFSLPALTSRGSHLPQVKFLVLHMTFRYFSAFPLKAGPHLPPSSLLPPCLPRSRGVTCSHPIPLCSSHTEFLFQAFVFCTHSSFFCSFPPSSPGYIILISHVSVWMSSSCKRLFWPPNLAWEHLIDVLIAPTLPSSHTAVMVGLFFFICFTCLHFPQHHI